MHETSIPAPVATRMCEMCGKVPITPRGHFCGPCRAQRSRESGLRYRKGLNLAPGEVSVSRKYALCGLRDIARQFNVTGSRVQQIERVALLKLRRALIPFLTEHDPVVADRWASRETPAQRWMARTSVRRQLSAEQSQIISQLRQLAKEYEKDGQPDIAVELRKEADDLVRRVEQVLGTRITVA